MHTGPTRLASLTAIPEGTGLVMRPSRPGVCEQPGPACSVLPRDTGSDTAREPPPDELQGQDPSQDTAVYCQTPQNPPTRAWKGPSLLEMADPGADSGHVLRPAPDPPGPVTAALALSSW